MARPRRTADGSPPIAPLLHRIEETKHRDGYLMLSYAGVLAKTGYDNVETAVRKRRISSSGAAVRIGNARLPKRGSVWEI